MAKKKIKELVTNKKDTTTIEPIDETPVEKDIDLTKTETNTTTHLTSVRARALNLPNFSSEPIKLSAVKARTIGSLASEKTIENYREIQAVFQSLYDLGYSDALRKADGKTIILDAEGHLSFK